MAGMNRVIIIGNLGQDPEIRYTQSQKAVATLSVATSESWKDDSGKQQEKTEWHRVIVWDKQAENAVKYLKKGSKVAVEGKLQTRSWDDKDGVKRYTTEIVANMYGGIHFLDSKGSSGGERAPHPGDAGAPVQSSNSGASDLDSIPF